MIEDAKYIDELFQMISAHIPGECDNQTSDGHGQWITYISERLNRLAEMGHRIPILDSINEMKDGYIKSWISEMEKKMGSMDSDNKSDGA